jgi:hypothetical protein
VEGRGGTGFLEGFNELVARCGLENTGAPCTDAKGSIFLPLHGRISNIPASSVWIEINWDTPCRLTVGGMVRETRMFGPSYLLTTRIITTVDSTRLEIIDEVTNLSSTPKEMELLYHINFGHPVLKDGARLCAPVEEVSAADEWALNDIDSWDTFGRPEPGRQEQCYFLKLLGDANSNTMVGLVDTEKANAVFMEFCIDQLPCFTLWKNTASLADGYVTGLEPGTDYPNPRPFEREKGRVVTLDLDEHYNACLALELASGREEVENFIQRIEAIGGSHKAVVHDFLNPEFSALT